MCFFFSLFVELMDFIEAEEIACDFIRKKVEAQKEYSYMTDSF